MQRPTSPINPHSAHIAVTRVDGVTNALSSPTGGLISGQSALINLLGTSPREMAVVPYAALVINYPRIGAAVVEDLAGFSSNKRGTCQTRSQPMNGRSNKSERCCAMQKLTAVHEMLTKRIRNCRGLTLM
jgi:hypothetical protein